MKIHNRKADLLSRALNLIEKAKAATPTDTSSTGHADQVSAFRDAARPEVVHALAAFVLQHLSRPLVWSEDGMLHFQPNAICHWLLETGHVCMNTISQQGFCDADRAEFAQLIGYSVSGWGELDYVTFKQFRLVQHLAELLPQPSKEGVSWWRVR
ncbi:MAG: hypothetical protein K2P94_08505 [Rhodospirillaceae bacterium]|nr:hypothetical protein [Rhodospirillaceae bacterium]